MNRVFLAIICLGTLSCACAVKTAIQQPYRPYQRDLVFMHIPYNFGHTVEMCAILEPETRDAVIEGRSRDVFQGEEFEWYHQMWDGVGDVRKWGKGENANKAKKNPLKFNFTMREVQGISKPNAEFWGHWHPDLLRLNEKTGCGMHFAPQKYWPTDLAEQYFGKKKVFGVLRDPYERCVAQFRGNTKGYGGSYEEEFKICDANGAVKKMLQSYLDGGKEFADTCSHLPQAEYFDGQYGITVPIDNRRFPDSVNEVYTAHGYDDFQIRTKDILHVNGCNNVWAADLEEDTKRLVRQVYARDFELLCKHFGYCDNEENACLPKVPVMCPEKAWEWQPDRLEYIRRV